MSARAPALEVVGLTKHFGGVIALSDCSIKVDPHTITGLAGPNGSGKSTLLNCVSGFLAPTKGEITLNGKRIDGMPTARRARCGLGRTFQTTRLFARLTVHENLRAAKVISGASGDLSYGIDLLKLFELSKYAAARASDLSYGQQRVLELVLVLMAQPSVVLLDEPAAGVNPRFLAMIRERLLELKTGGTTFLIVEHNMPFLTDLCDELYVLADGRNFAQGTPHQVVKDPRVLRAYLGEETA